MTDALDGAREHYRSTGLTEWMKLALTCCMRCRCAG
jgi:hypothetical protein